MIAYAAIDLREGAVVQLVGGRPEAERVRIADPAAVARRWCEAGYRALHVVDLDAALGSGGNAEGVRAVLDAADVPVQVGGGVRDEPAVERLVEAGADRVVVGTRAVEDRTWLESIARRWPGRIVVAADVRGGRIVTRGWTSDTALAADSFVEGLRELPLASVLVTDTDREGAMSGADTPLFARLVRAAGTLPLLAAGGIAGPADLDALARAGAAGAVLGMALYTGAFPEPFRRR